MTAGPKATAIVLWSLVGVATRRDIPRMQKKWQMDCPPGAEEERSSVSCPGYAAWGDARRFTAFAWIYADRRSPAEFTLRAWRSPAGRRFHTLCHSLNDIL